MTGADVLDDSFGRIRDIVHRVVDGLKPDHVGVRLDPEANSIGWLLWHLTRIQDDHVAAVAETEQGWTSAGWAGRFDLPLDVSDTGYGHTAQQVAVVTSAPTMLREYHDAVLRRCSGMRTGSTSPASPGPAKELESATGRGGDHR